MERAPESELDLGLPGALLYAAISSRPHRTVIGGVLRQGHARDKRELMLYVNHVWHWFFEQT